MRAERRRAGNSGPEVGDFGRLLRRGRDVGGDGLMPDFHRAERGRETENLRNWKPDIQTGEPAFQNFRFSGFQVSTRTTVSEILPNEPGRGEAVSALNGRFMLKPGISGLAYINKQLTTGDDPARTFMT